MRGSGPEAAPHTPPGVREQRSSSFAWARGKTGLRTGDGVPLTQGHCLYRPVCGGDRLDFALGEASALSPRAHLLLPLPGKPASLQSPRCGDTAPAQGTKQCWAGLSPGAGFAPLQLLLCLAESLQSSRVSKTQRKSCCFPAPQRFPVMVRKCHPSCGASPCQALPAPPSRHPGLLLVLPGTSWASHVWVLSWLSSPLFLDELPAPAPCPLVLCVP